MTNERKAELFDSALNVIFSRMKFYDETEYEEVLQEIGFTAEEIDEMLRDIARAFEEDEPSSLMKKLMQQKRIEMITHLFRKIRVIMIGIISDEVYKKTYRYVFWGFIWFLILKKKYIIFQINA